MENKKMLKWLTGLILAMMIFVGIGPAFVHADEHTGPKTDVVITKVDTVDEPANMTLEQLAEGINVTTYFTEARELEGVSFTWYSVTEAELITLNANPESYSTPQQMSNADFGSGTPTAETDTNGQVTIPDLEEGYYWIVENVKGTIQSSRAVPFGLALPFTNSEGTGWLDTIYVYPKNTLEDVPMDGDLVKTVVDVDGTAETKDFNYGDTVTWDITIAIPEGIEDYAEFIVRDPEIDGLEYVVDSASSSIGNPTISYDDGLTVNFFDVLGDLSGEDFVTITFDVTFTDAIDPDVLTTNTAYLDFDNGHGDTGTIDDDASVITGGEQFLKYYLSGETKEGLDGAVFVIRNEVGEYLNTDDNAVTFGDRNAATEFTSGDAGEDGTFEVKGLAEGSYILEEIKAPSGYALPTDPDTDFKVVAAHGEGSYTLETEEILNRAITIPQTGGMGTMAFTLLGGALMASAVGYYKKTSKES